MGRLQARFAGRLSGVFVEPMITGGIETIVGVVQEPVFGPVVVFGLGGVATEALGDHVARLAPLTSVDADDLIHSVRAAAQRLLRGARGSRPAADIGALRGILLRISRLADDLPEVAELDLNPVIARPDGVTAADARIRVSSHRLADPFLRQSPVGPGPGASASRTAGSSMVEGACSSRPSAIPRMVLRSILPDRVLGRAATTSTRRSAATGPI